jgi:hypothetical protein
VRAVKVTQAYRFALDPAPWQELVRLIQTPHGDQTGTAARQRAAAA